MVIFGVDAHKHTHTVVAVDEHGRQLGSRTVRTSTSDHLALLRWATQFPGRRQWAIEDCRHLSRRLERDLLGAGEVVVRVPPKLMANVRDCARTYGKSDPIDALAVARALLREPGLPAARLDGPERQVRLLVDHREDLVAERTRVIGRLRWRLHELDPTCLIHPGSRRSRAGPGQRLRRRPRTSGRAPRPRSAGPATRPDPGRALPVLTAQIDDLTAEIDARIGQLVPTLLAVVGVGPLTAASFSVRPPEWTASAARTPTPGSTAQRRSRSGPPTVPGTGSLAPATVRSTPSMPRCTGSP